MSLGCKALPNLSNPEKKDSVVSSAKEFGKLLRLENLTHDLFYYCNVRSICCIQSCGRTGYSSSSFENNN